MNKMRVQSKVKERRDKMNRTTPIRAKSIRKNRKVTKKM